MTELQMLAAIPARYFAAWNGSDSHALDDFFAGKFLWVDPLLPAPVTDLQGARQFLAGSRRSFPDMRFEMIGGPMIDAQNHRVSQQWRMLATNDGEFMPGKPASGKSIDLVGIDVWTVERGRVAQMQACYDALALMRQMGVT